MSETVWDKIATLVPSGRDAAVAVSGGEGWTPQAKLSSCPHWKAPPPMQVPRHGLDLRGTRFGRFTVIGLMISKRSGNAAWVCKCTCGDYEPRTAKAIRNPQNAESMCMHCAYLEKLRAKDKSSTGSSKARQRQEGRRLDALAQQQRRA